ncbi:MAG: hypothetical protein ACO3O7_05665 [Ilumatobacteraceae bacterium]
MTEASEAVMARIPHSDTALIATTVWEKEPSYTWVQTAFTPDDKVKLLLNAVSSSAHIHTTLVLACEEGEHLVSSRRDALEWLGVVKRPIGRNSMIDADGNEYVNEHDLEVTR